VGKDHSLRLTGIKFCKSLTEVDHLSKQFGLLGESGRPYLTVYEGIMGSNPIQTATMPLSSAEERLIVNQKVLGSIPRGAAHRQVAQHGRAPA